MGMESPNIENQDEQVTSDELKEVEAWAEPVNGIDDLDLVINEDSAAEISMPGKEDGLAEAA